MADTRRTHRGKMIDVDLVRMKWELELKDINKVNIKREKEVDNKRRRGNSDKINEMLANQEMVRQKLRDQKAQRNKDEDENQTPAQSEAQQAEKDKPDVTGRKIVKR